MFREKNTESVNNNFQNTSYKHETQPGIWTQYEHPNSTWCCRTEDRNYKLQ